MRIGKVAGEAAVKKLELKIVYKTLSCRTSLSLISSFQFWRGVGLSEDLTEWVQVIWIQLISGSGDLGSGDLKD